MDCLQFLSILFLAVVINGQTTRKFPDTVKFGVATAAYQIEGAWNVSDKGESIWDYLVHETPWVVTNLETGDVAADSYHKYKRDVEMLKELGVDFYRFSISWSRVLPTGFANKISVDGIAYYNNLIDELLANGIEPIISMYHWDLPQPLQLLGGLANPKIADYFFDYARVLFENYGDRVKTWVTFNEPLVICNEGFANAGKAPLIAMPGIAEYLCGRTLLVAHAKAYRLYEAEFKDLYQGRVGMAEHIVASIPNSDAPEDIEATEVYQNFLTAWFLDPIATGDYSPLMKRLVAERSQEQGYPRSRLPEFTEEEKEMLKGSMDFVGINHYVTNLIYQDIRDVSNEEPSLDTDMQIGTTRDPSWKVSTSSPWLSVNPVGLRLLLVKLKERYNNPEIMILENGYSTPSGESLYDDDRIEYYRLYMDAMLDAILEDGCNVTAYTAWSLMDNFEWMEVFGSRFGLYEVDFDSPEKTRTARKSALVYKEIIRSRTIDYSYEPTILDITNS